MTNGPHPDHWQPQHRHGSGYPGYGAPQPGYGAPQPGYGGPPQGYGPGPYGGPNQMLYDAQKKSVGVAYLLWVFLGGFGAHRFYLGQSGTGAAMLILCLVGIVTSLILVGILLLIPLWIWIIVDAFLIPGMARDYNMRLAHHYSR